MKQDLKEDSFQLLMGLLRLLTFIILVIFKNQNDSQDHGSIKSFRDFLKIIYVFASCTLQSVIRKQI